MKIPQLNNESLFRTSSYINGEWIKAEHTFPIYNPANGEQIAEVSSVDDKEVAEAIEAAETSFHLWKNYSAGKRSRILKNWYKLILENVDDLARILTAEQGKPFSEAKGEIKYGASFVEWFAEEAKRTYGDVIPSHQSDKRLITIKQAIGVVAAITPWNFPNAMITRKVAPALAAGCTVIIKPAQDTPLSALALAELADQAGIPKGVLNVITALDPKPIGDQLMASSKVRKLSFTGSTRIGKLLMSQASSTVKKVSLELGGNAPFIVFEDADIDKAITGAIAAKYRNSGQTCICANRFYVQENVFDSFCEKFAAAISDLKQGDGMDEGVSIGPMINEAAILKVDALLEDAKEKGAEIRSGGNALSEKRGYFFEPTLITSVRSDMRIHSEEIFGPIAAVYKFETEEEVIAQANDTNYGLAAYFYTKDNARTWRVSEALEYGMVGINTGMISTPAAPFGGVKESGIGREGSKYGIDEFMDIKYICIGDIT